MRRKATFSFHFSLLSIHLNLLPQSAALTAPLHGRRNMVSAEILTAFPLRGRWAADCAARMRWQLFISLFIKLRLDFFHLISRLRASVSLRLGHAPALNVHRTFIHYRRAASLPCNKGRLEKFLLTSKYFTYNIPFFL